MPVLVGRRDTETPVGASLDWHLLIVIIFQTPAFSTDKEPAAAAAVSSLQHVGNDGNDSPPPVADDGSPVNPAAAGPSMLPVSNGAILKQPSTITRMQFRTA